MKTKGFRGPAVLHNLQTMAQSLTRLPDPLKVRRELENGWEIAVAAIDVA